MYARALIAFHLDKLKMANDDLDIKTRSLYTSLPFIVLSWTLDQQ